MKVLSVLAALLLTFPNLQAGPQASAPASTSSSQAATLLTQSAAALTGNVALTDVALTGTARRIAGSDDESGTATYKAISGANRLDERSDQTHFVAGVHTRLPWCRQLQP